MGHEWLFVLFLLHLVRLIFTVTRYSTPDVSYQETMSLLLVLTQSIQLLTLSRKCSAESEAPGATVPVCGSPTKSWFPPPIRLEDAQWYHGPLSAPTICAAHSFALHWLHCCSHRWVSPVPFEGDNNLSLVSWQPQSSPRPVHMAFRMHRAGYTLFLSSPCPFSHVFPPYSLSQSTQWESSNTGLGIKQTWSICFPPTNTVTLSKHLEALVSSFTEYR